MEQWLTDFRRLSQLADEVFADLNERNRCAQDKTQVSKLTTSIRRKLNQLSSEIGNLDDDLTRAERSGSRITSNEISRRRDMLLNLANRKDQLTSMLRTTPGSLSTQDQRNTLFSSEPSRSKKRAWGTPQETEATRDFDNRGLLDQQQLIMQQQDDSLDTLSATIQRQREIAIDIGSEVDLHTGLLDDLDSQTERATSGVYRETRRVQTFEKKAKTGMMYCIIVALLILLIVLVAVPAPK